MHPPRRSPGSRRAAVASPLFAVLLGTLLVASGCETKPAAELLGGGGPGDLGAGADAGHVSDAGVDAGAQVDPELRFGAPETLEIATWNLHNFPTDDHSVGAVADLVLAMDLDVVALQEVADVLGFQRLLEELPGYGAALSDHRYSSTNYQKTAFLFRQDELTLRQSISIFQDDIWAFPRPPLQAEFDVLRPDGTTWHLVIIDVHLKAMLGEDNEARRRSACSQLEAWVRAQAEREGVGGVMVLGDFNDELSDSPDDNVFAAFLDAPDLYRFTTWPLSEDEEFSYIAYASMIDHILVSLTLDATVSEQRTVAIPLERLVSEYSYRNRVSDHRPVLTIFER